MHFPLQKKKKCHFVTISLYFDSNLIISFPVLMSDDNGSLLGKQLVWKWSIQHHVWASSISKPFYENHIMIIETCHKNASLSHNKTSHLSEHTLTTTHFVKDEAGTELVIEQTHSLYYPSLSDCTN